MTVHTKENVTVNLNGFALLYFALNFSWKCGETNLSAREGTPEKDWKTSRIR
jgi:hypothetical protein